MRTVMIVRGEPVTEHDDERVSFRAGFTIDADGSPHAYAPPPLRGLDHLANAGHPGNWWGIATTTAGAPFVQEETDPAPGFYVSTTSYERIAFARRDPRRYVDSETVPFIVVPAPLRKRVRGIVLGCDATVEDIETGKIVRAVVADFGPATHLGEGSIALANLLGIPSDPRTGGTDDKRFQWSFRPGLPALVNGEQFELISV